MMFDTSDCNVQVDFSRFRGPAITNSLTVEYLGHEGEGLKKKMKTSIRPRCTSLLYDQRINDTKTSLLNFHHAHVFCALRTAEYCKALQREDVINPSFLAGCVKEVITYSYKLIMNGMHRHNDSICPSGLFATLLEAHIIGKYAYIAIFKQCQHIDSSVIAVLQKWKTRLSPKSSKTLHAFAESSLNLFGPFQT
jgi:hypothetical protein